MTADADADNASEDRPTMTVVTEHVTVDVVDRTSAEVALKLIDRVLPAYIGETAHVSRSRDVSRVKYHAECPACGHDWLRKAENDDRAICPECTHSWQHDVPGRERPGAEVVE